MKTGQIPRQLQQIPPELVNKDKYNFNLVSEVKLAMIKAELDINEVIYPFLNDEDIQMVSGDDTPDALQRTVINLYFRRVFSVLDSNEALLACACLREYSEMYTTDWIKTFKDRVIPVLKTMG